jgi:hypothetical protein
VGGIIWLASYPKSGNTWTRAFLHNFIKQAENSAESGYDINKMNALSSSDNGHVWYEEVLGKPVKEASHDELTKARPLAHKYIHDQTEGFIFLKTHNALVVHDGVPLHTPQYTAGAVYIVRNPLDVAISYSFHMNMTIDEIIEVMSENGYLFPTNEKSVFQIQGSWTEHVHSWTRRPNPSMFVMRYEDMLDRPFDTFGDLVEFLHLPRDPLRLRTAIDMSSFKNLQDMEKKDGFRERPKHADKFFREGKAGQWKTELSVNQIKRIVKEHGEQMERFGYMPDVQAFLRNPIAGRKAAMARATA